MQSKRAEQLNTSAIDGRKHTNQFTDFYAQLNIEELKKDYLETVELEGHIQALKNSAIMDSGEAANEMKMLNQKKLKAKEDIAKKIHVSKDGTPRKIPTEPNAKGFFRTTMPDGSELAAKERNILIDKILNYYGVTVDSGSLEEIFLVADIDYLTSNNLDVIETGNRHKQDFKRYFGKIKDTDITSWNRDKFNEYVKNRIKELELIESAISKFQAITNVIFNYAFEKRLIDSPWHKTIKWTTFYQYAKYEPKDDSEEIFSQEEIEMIWKVIEERKNNPEKYFHYYHGYYACGYAIEFTSLVGTRIGEIPALLWKDIIWDKNYIRIHRQQKKSHNGISEEVPFTKNEKRHPKNGRVFILTPKLRALLSELKAKQESLGIKSDHVFCNLEGKPLKKKTIYDALRRLCRETLNLSISKCHAFRKALNSSDEMQKLTSAQRGKAFGHSPRVNDEHYTKIPEKDLIKAMSKVYGMDTEDSKDMDATKDVEETSVYAVLGTSENSLPTHSRQNLIIFPNKKILKTTCLQDS